MLRLFCLTIYHTVSGKRKEYIKKMTGREPVCPLPTILPNAIFKQLRSLNIAASCTENAYDYLMNHSVREMHDDRKMKEEIESAGGEVGKGGGVNGNVAEAQWNYINLSKCI